jgi:putative monooxygenase
VTESNIRVARLEDLEPVDRGSGIVSYQISDANGSGTLLAGISILPPGTAIPMHAHDAEECIVLLQGAAVCESPDAKYGLVPFDATIVRAGSAHRFVNSGAVPVMILWIYPQQGVTRTLLDSGRSLGHLDPYP